MSIEAFISCQRDRNSLQHRGRCRLRCLIIDYVPRPQSLAGQYQASENRETRAHHPDEAR